MSVIIIGQYASDALAAALVVRLLLLRLHTVYRVFCAFVILDLFSSFLFFLAKFLGGRRLDYRLAWMALQPFVWVLVLWMVYALLDAMLGNLRGILRLSRKLLNGAFAGALSIAFVLALLEYFAFGVPSARDPLNRAVGVALVLEQVIFIAAVLVLIAILGFILWFPVEMPRNLAIFSIGFGVFFSVSATTLLLHTYWRPVGVGLASDVLTFALAGCYAYWFLFITREGEMRSVRMGHSWEPGAQQRMIGELEAMNAALLHASRR